MHTRTHANTHAHAHGLQGSKYNIPVAIWLPERYPYEGPLLYVVPTANMVIKGGHPFVDRNGQVCLLVCQRVLLG